MTYSTPQRLALAAALLAGLHARTYALDHALWLDESWVANSVLEPSFTAMFSYESWLQTTPPLFLVLQRAVVSVLGTSNLVWRLLPTLASLAMLGVAAHLALKVVRPWLGVAFVWALALSPALVLHAGMAKPYATDAAAAILMLWAGLATSNVRTRMMLVPLLGLLSYTALLMLPGLLWVSLDQEDRDLRSTGALAAIGAATIAIAQGVFIAPNRGESLVDYWVFGFFRGDVGAWLSRVASTLGGPVFGPSPVATAVSVSALAGLGILATRATERTARHQLAMLGSGPAALIALNLLGVYPIADRLTLFTVAAWFLLACIPFDALTERANRPALDALWAGGLAAGAALVFGLYGPLHLEAPGPESTDDAVAFLRKEASSDDLIYVHASLREPFRLYDRDPSLDARVVLGEIGWPCCPRFGPEGKPADNLRREVGRLRPLPSSVWLLYTNRRAHWNYVDADHRQQLRQSLTRLGCTRGVRKGFGRVGLEQFTCRGGAGE